MEHNFFDSVFVLLFYFLFFIFLLTPVARQIKTESEKLQSCHVTLLLPPLLLLFPWVLLLFSVSVSVSVPIVGVIVVVFLVYWGRVAVGMCILAGGRWLIMPDPWPFFSSD